MKSLKPRLLTALVGITLLLIILFVGEYWTPVIGFIVGIATAFMTGEYLHAKNLLKTYGISVPCMAFSFALPVIITTSYIYLLVFSFMIVLFLVMIIKHRKISFADLAYSATGTLLISFGMSAISASCSSGSVIFSFVVIFALPWMADAGGFFIGASMGKHKLCPSISPKKTVEGAVGGVVFCILSAVIVGLLFQFIIMPDVKISFIALVLLGAIDALLAILGDLSFSLIKRSFNIKDYGSIFPGHGGMLDRFDSIIFTAPVVIILNNFIPFITMV